MYTWFTTVFECLCGILMGKWKRSCWAFALDTCSPSWGLLAGVLGWRLNLCWLCNLCMRGPWGLETLGWSSAEADLLAWLPPWDHRLIQSRATSHLFLNSWQLTWFMACDRCSENDCRLIDWMRQLPPPPLSKAVISHTKMRSRNGRGCRELFRPIDWMRQLPHHHHWARQWPSTPRWGLGTGVIIHTKMRRRNRCDHPHQDEA